MESEDEEREQFARDARLEELLRNAILKRSTEQIAALIAAGADCNAPGDNCEYPMHLAAKLDAVEIVKQLLAAGGWLDARNSADQTPLHVAARAGAHQTVKALLDAGIDPLVVDANGNTAAKLASGHGFDGIAKIISLAPHGHSLNRGM